MRLKTRIISWSIFTLLGIVALCYGAATDYKVTNDGTVYSYDLITKGPWVDSRAYDTLSAANTAAVSAGKTLLIGQNYTLTANTTLTAAVVVPKGCGFTKASTYTLTIKGPFEAGLYQVFSGFGAGDVTFGAGAVKEDYPQWWGENTTPGTTDMSDAIQAAISAWDNGTKISGKVKFPKGIYLVNTPITIGNGRKYVDLEIEGISIVYASFIPNGPVTIKTTSATGNLFNITMATNYSGLVIKGFTFEHPAGATGVSLDFVMNPGGYLKIEDSAFYHSGIGIYWRAGNVSPILRDICFYDCTTAGLRVGGVVTTGTLDHVYFQQGVTNGILIDAGAVLSAHFKDCVFQANTGVDIQLNGSLQSSIFTSCHWEAPGSDFIRISTGNLLNVSFDRCQFDGSNGAGGRTVIHNAAADSSSLYGQDLVFNNSAFGNLNGGKILTSDVAIDSSADPGYFRVTMIGGYSTETGTLFDGFHTSSTQPRNFLMLIGTPFSGRNFSGDNAILLEIAAASSNFTNLYPNKDNAYYLGKNDDDSPLAWKGVILKDTANGRYYRIEITNGRIVATDLTD